ncbi:MAG: prepilin-type N-terminal cleavage/methylation domain-containing protein [Candidatus Portnoybacteria bacterium]|nr:prepilin-type N-terminal cleavage/methylation domain-containing protein [Candidatus Portnoybacteria bacterium]
MKNKGFTLVELLVVIAIIGLLTGMVVISIQHVKAKARDSQRVSDINSIATALALYHNDNNNYPIYDGYITSEDDLSVVLEGADAINEMPIDPINQGDYRYYYQSTDGSDYYIEYYLETDSMSGKSNGLNYHIP